MLHKNQIEQATITAMSSDGNGIAKIDGMVVFVPYTAVGGPAAGAHRQGAEKLCLRHHR